MLNITAQNTKGHVVNGFFFSEVCGFWSHHVTIAFSFVMMQPQKLESFLEHHRSTAFLDRLNLQLPLEVTKVGKNCLEIITYE